MIELWFKTKTMACPRPRVRRGWTYYPKTYVAWREAIRMEAAVMMSERRSTRIAWKFRFYAYLEEDRRSDLDNRLKALLDALQGIAFVNDRDATELHVSQFHRRDPYLQGWKAIIKIMEV